MRTQEDKYIASQLNSLNSLPEGYQANLASKWEMVQMGMEQKKRRSPILYWMAAAACLILMLGTTWFYMISNKQEQGLATSNGQQKENIIIKQEVSSNTKSEIPATTVAVEQKTKNSTSTIAPKKSFVPVVNAVDTSSFAINNTVEQHIQPKNAEQKPLLIDSSSSIASAQQPVAKKTKQRFYQMDFGEGTPNDPKQKVATNKLIQFKFSNKVVDDGSSHPSSKTALPKITQPL